MSEKFVTPEPLPTERQREILVILIEEAAEVQQRATKALRFGLQEVQPGQACTNVERLSLEVGDLLEMIFLAQDTGLLDSKAVRLGQIEKRRKLKIYMQSSDSDTGGDGG